MEIWVVLFYLRNVQKLTFNHKRVYRIYRELELNPRINHSARFLDAYIPVATQ